MNCFASSNSSPDILAIMASLSGFTLDFSLISSLIFMTSVNPIPGSCVLFRHLFINLKIQPFREAIPR